MENDARRALVWVLADDRPGNLGQCLGVAEALGLPFLVKRIVYTRAGALPNALRGASLCGVDEAARRELTPPWPRVVVAAGRRTAPVARWIARQAPVFLAQIMDPGPPGRGEFGLIAVPGHDRAPPLGANVLRITGAPHRVTPGRLAAEAERFRACLDGLPRPWILVSVGGATRRRPFGADRAAALGRQVAGLGGSLLVTTSRRTGPRAEAALLAEIPEPRRVFRWGEEGDNPYFGWLGLADAVVVTGDSVSMVCEACAAGVPVFVYAPPGMVGEKHARLHRELFEKGFARPLGAGLERFDHHPPLDAARQIADEIMRRAGV